MSENKRFSETERACYYTTLVFDNQTQEKLGTSKVVDLLNDFSEENKKLKEEWEFSFRTELAHHRVTEKELKEKIREQQATISALKEENRKLKNIHWY